jgi:hypothetical protein
MGLYMVKKSQPNISQKTSPFFNGVNWQLSYNLQSNTTKEGENLKPTTE